MIRALVIRLGEALGPAVDRLDAEFAARRESGLLERARLETVDAPVAAVGNLSRPVQLLREQLEADLIARITRLLELSPTSSGDFVLDVFILLNLGEPLVSNATRVIIEILDRIVDTHFRAIFPPHRVGTARRFRVLPIAILPSASECQKDRPEALRELEELHDYFNEARAADESRVDRLFLLDALTARGIAPLGDLVDQIHSFLRLVVMGGVRRETDFVGLFESERNDLFASFGVACAEVDFAGLRAMLTERLTQATAAQLGDAGPSLATDIDDVLPQRAMQGGDHLDQVLTNLESVPLRVLGAEGFGAVRPLLSLYDALLARVESWRESAGHEVAVNKHAAPTAASARSERPNAAGIGLGVGIVSGVALGAAAHFFALTTLAVTLASGGGFALFAFLLTWMVLRRPAPPDTERGRSDAAVDASEEASSETILDILEHAVRGPRGRLAALAECLDGLAHDFGASPTGDSPPPVGRFRDSLVSDELQELFYERCLGASDVRNVAADWLSSLGTWDELLSAKRTARGEDLLAFCASRFQAIGASPLFADIDCRQLAEPRVGAFLSKWSGGVGVFLEGESRKQFDPDGFYTPFTHHIFAPRELVGDISSLLRGKDAVLKLHPLPLQLDDVFILTTVADVHPDAVAAIADNRPPS